MMKAMRPVRLDCLAAGILVLSAGSCGFDAAGLQVGGKQADASPRDAAVPDLPPPPSPCDPTDTDLRACYEFERNVDDGSGYGNDGSETGAIYQAGVTGRAIQSDSDSRIVVPDSDSLDPTAAFTIETWIAPSSLPGGGQTAYLVHKNGQYSLLLEGTELQCATATDLVRGQPVVPGLWTHVACTFDGKQLVLYQNGVATAIALASGVPAGGDELVIGGQSPCPAACGLPFLGRIDELRLWSIPRTREQICAAARLSGC